MALFWIIPVGAADLANGEKIFHQSCWGCHHPTAEAFGPSFHDIALKRSDGEIKGQIVRPDLLYKNLGYARNSMPSFTLTGEELDDITAYIKSFK